MQERKQREGRRKQKGGGRVLRIKEGGEEWEGVSMNVERGGYGKGKGRDKEGRGCPPCHCPAQVWPPLSLCHQACCGRLRWLRRRDTQTELVAC